jgi:hypothetical protein
MQSAGLMRGVLQIRSAKKDLSELLLLLPAILILATGCLALAGFIAN